MNNAVPGLKPFLHGIIYQLKLLMLFLKWGLDKGYSFCLATEMNAAEKFDDLIFKYREGNKEVYRFLQAKHQQAIEENKITAGKLLSESNDEPLSLRKYFISYLKIKYRFDKGDFKGVVKDLTICTNIDFDFESPGKLQAPTRGPWKGKVFSLEEIINTDPILSTAGGKRYQLINCSWLEPLFIKALEEEVKELGQEIQRLEETIKEEKDVSKKQDKTKTLKEVQRLEKALVSKPASELGTEFLTKLIFAVHQPSEAELDDIIRNAIGEAFDLITTDSIYNGFMKWMLDWLKERKGQFLSSEAGLRFFEQAREKVSMERSMHSKTHKGLEEVKEEIRNLGKQQAVSKEESIQFDMRETISSFTGREEELETLHEAVQGSPDRKITVIAQMASISGLGGIGKSELARKYACDHKKDYDGNLIWINAETFTNLKESFRRLTKEELNIPTTENKDGKEQARSIGCIVKDVYKYFTTNNKKVLFIFDNAEKYRTQKEGDEGIDSFLPLPTSSNACKPHIYIVITSRNQSWGNIKVVPLGTFTEAEAITFITKELAIEDSLQEKEIKELAKILQYLPLTLQQAVAYIKERDKVLKNVGSAFKVNDYLNRYKEEAYKLLNFPFPEDSDNPYTKTTLTTWKVTLGNIAQKAYGKQALAVLDIAAYLAPDNISPKTLLRLVNGDEEQLGSAIELIRQYSMINSEQGVLSIHRLVQQVIRLGLQNQGKEEEILRKALKLINRTDIVSSHITSIWAYTSKYGPLIDEFYDSIYGKEQNTPLHLLAYNGYYQATKAV